MRCQISYNNKNMKKVSFNEEVNTILIPRSEPRDKDILYYGREDFQQFRRDRRYQLAMEKETYLFKMVETYVEWASCERCLSMKWDIEIVRNSRAVAQ
mmetsp:Transcript_40906/g.46475  ORF Transcript_40906/g.46475 Transcript_40906/m.46475 type:complete len:98 (+) Transcript_40906:87-380(+)